MTGTKWAIDPLVIQFIKVTKKTTFPKWDLAVALKALSRPPFFISELATLWDLTLKV